jgi:hypothetical protein
VRACSWELSCGLFPPRVLWTHVDLLPGFTRDVLKVKRRRQAGRCQNNSVLAPSRRLLGAGSEKRYCSDGGNGSFLRVSLRFHALDFVRKLGTSLIFTVNRQLGLDGVGRAGRGEK